MFLLTPRSALADLGFFFFFLGGGGGGPPPPWGAVSGGGAGTWSSAVSDWAYTAVAALSRTSAVSELLIVDYLDTVISLAQQEKVRWARKT